MKHFRKSFLALLALTLFGGAGAWAQGPTNVIEITADMVPASWQTSDDDLTLEALQELGFEAVDVSVAQAWTGAPQDGSVVLIYGFNGGNVNYIQFSGGHAYEPSHISFTKRGFYNDIAYINFFITTAPAEIELTKVGDNQWSLGQTPDYDLELQVEYYEKHALKNIPAGWTVKINGEPQQTPYQGDSLLITETDSVTLVPDGNPRRVKSVTLEEDGPAVQTVNIDGVNLLIAEGDTWADIIARNPGVIWIKYDVNVEGEHGLLVLHGSGVLTSDPYVPSADYDWMDI